jgi:hypothetical protein
MLQLHPFESVILGSPLSNACVQNKRTWFCDNLGAQRIFVSQLNNTSLLLFLLCFIYFVGFFFIWHKMSQPCFLIFFFFYLFIGQKIFKYLKTLVFMIKSVSNIYTLLCTWCYKELYITSAIIVEATVLIYLIVILSTLNKQIYQWLLNG